MQFIKVTTLYCSNKTEKHRNNQDYLNKGYVMNEIKLMTGGGENSLIRRTENLL